MSQIDNPNSAHAWNSYWQSYIRMQEILPTTGWRNRLILDELRRINPDSKQIFEFGCGPGILSQLIAYNFPNTNIVSLDQSEEALAFARAHIKYSPSLPNVVFVRTDMLNRTQMRTILDHYGKASIAICSEVLEHIEEEAAFLSIISESLLDGNQGTLILTVPGGPQSKFTRHVGHIRHYTKEYLTVLLSKYFHDITIYCAGFPFFNLYKLSTVLAGQTIIHDGNQNPSLLTRFACRLFKYLFTINLNKTSLGWQLLAVCKK